MKHSSSNLSKRILSCILHNKQNGCAVDDTHWRPANQKNWSRNNEVSSSEWYLETIVMVISAFIYFTKLK